MLRYLHFALWSGLFAIFVWISGPIVGSAVRENRLSPMETNSSIDSYLRPFTGIENGADKLPDIFRGLGKDGSLVIFVRAGNSQSEFLGMLMAYVAWPREVQLITVPGAAVEKELTNINPGAVAGAVFCSVSPPSWLQNRIQLGSNLILVPVTEAAAP